MSDAETLNRTKGSAVGVRIDAGRLRGRPEGDILVFRGVPYAAPPVGPLRWRAPQPVTPWAGVRPALEFGFDCFHVEDPGDPLAGTRPHSEDCLTLNIWSPAKPSAASLPVLVWIHGGGFTNGASSATTYDGAAFARRGLVVVTINYRLGRFGFFAHQALTREAGGERVGNFGLMDQLAALEWVRRNIAAFGGDPGSVTIMGESAGGWSVNMLMTSPPARGLFHRAVAESAGGRVGTFGKSLVSWQKAQEIGETFAAHLGIAGGDASAMAALRALPPEALQVAPFFIAPRETYSGPMVDGWLVPKDPGAAFAEGAVAPAPYLVGCNSREVDDMAEARPMAAALLKDAGPVAAALAKAYGSADAAEGGLMGDIVFVEPARYSARCAAERERAPPVYLYRFGYVPQAHAAQLRGAAHTTEVPFVFDKTGSVDERDLAVGRMMNGYWANFVRSGDPNGPGLARWPRYDLPDEQLLFVERDGSARAAADPKAAILDVLAASPFDPA
ncbi:MAG: carboxylesterase [Phenylobacterium sp.]|nr:carboxylesterase [Phenylobacterium sp.]